MKKNRKSGKEKKIISVHPLPPNYFKLLPARSSEERGPGQLAHNSRRRTWGEDEYH
jgi:hypothetical protein